MVYLRTSIVILASTVKTNMQVVLAGLYWMDYIKARIRLSD